MPDPIQYYEILEVEPGASADAIKQAYRDLAQVWHPDRFANSPRLQEKAAEKMKAINEAYEFLRTYRPEPTRTPPTAYRPATPNAYPSSRPEPASQRPRPNQPLSDEIWCLRGHSALVSSVAFSPSSKLLISGSYDKTVRIWQTGTGLEKLWFLGHKGAVTSVAFAPDNRGALSAGMDKSIFLRDCETKKEIQYFYASAVVECAAISADGRYLLSGTVGAGTQLWEVSSGRELRKFTVGGFVSSVCFSPRSSLIAIGTSDGEVCIFDRLDGRLVTAARVARNGVGQMVETVKFTRDGAYLLTASPTQLQLWQSASGRESSRVEIGVVGVTSADLSPTGGSIVTGHSDSSVRLWSVTQGTELHVYHGHTETVKAVAYAPDGQSVASGGFDKTVRIWRVRRDAQA